MIQYLLGIIGTWILADGVASLWTYTGPRKHGQTFWRDHALRIVRSVCGIVLMVFGGINAHKTSR